MKHVVGVSLGSSRRDHHVEVELMGERVRIERRGTDGDLQRAVALIRELDGHVDAIGLGGIDRYIWAGTRRFEFRDGRRLAEAARVTPVVDGSGLKNSLERWVVPYMRDTLGIPLKGQRVLMVSACDRFGMAEALTAQGCQMVFGDLIFALGIPIPLRSLRSVEILGRIIAPVIVRLPFKMLYPTGDKQHASRARHERFYRWADILAGDFHFIRRYMPDDLRGKIVVTNTVTQDDIDDLRNRGARCLVTTTPDLDGRSFGTNVIEATLVALAGQGRELHPNEYIALIERIGLRPRFVQLTP